MPIHLEIYRRRPEVVCVVHTHAIYAAALSATTAGFQMVSQDSVLFSNGIGYYGSALLIVTPEQGRAMAESLGDYHAVLLKNHGIAVVGRTVQEATVRAVAFDRSARLQLAASQLGPLSPIQPNEAQEMGAGFERSVARTLGIWEYLLRKADRNGPARV
jgi:L-fuculose-phosphate aldolase